MKRIILNVLNILLCIYVANAQVSKPQLPDSVYTGPQGKFHVQGTAVDTLNECVYFSFTNKLIKTDYSGKLIGSVVGFSGHLGDLDFDETTGKVYGSLEYKSDVIGKGISKELGIEVTEENGFYIAVFDGAKIVRPDMNAEEGHVLYTINLNEPLADFEASVNDNGQDLKHKYGCSGIDGVALAPAIGGKKDGKKFLYVAYGVYGDVTRTDNEYQVILKYDVSKWDALGKPLVQGNLHRSGPKKALAKYFVYTGTTTYGIQNLAYDSSTGNFYAAVYKGKKTTNPNYDLFLIDGQAKSKKSILSIYSKPEKVETLRLVDKGLKDAKNGIRGWNFKYGATGLCPVGDGVFYISHPNKTRDGQQETVIYKYQWTGDATTPFKR